LRSCSSVEVVINGSFLAKANLGGLLGGAVQAVTFAALNIIASFFWGPGADPACQSAQLSSEAGWRRVVPRLSPPSRFALNLTLSHLREIPPAVSLSDNVGQEVLHRLLTAPFALTDINSWLLFSLGFVFSLIAMADGLMFFDPYMGYAGLDRRWIEATRQFADTRGELIERASGYSRGCRRGHERGSARPFGPAQRI